MRDDGRATALLGGAACVLLATVDVVAGTGTVLTTVLVVPPLVVATRSDPRPTAAVAVLAFVLAVVLGFANDEFGNGTHLVRLLVVGTGGGLAVWIADLRRRAELERGRMAFLAEVTTQIDASLDFNKAGETLAGLAVPQLADWAAVYVDGEGEPMQQLALAPSGRDRYPSELRPEGSVANVIRTGRPELLADVAERRRVSRAVERKPAATSREMRVRSAMFVPLRARGRTFGALALATAQSGRFYDERDLDVACNLAERASLALDNARLYTEITRAEAEVRRSADEVEAILRGVASGITVQDPSGGLIFANQTAAEMLKAQSVETLLASPPERIMDRFEIRDEDLQPLTIGDLPGRIALAGERPPDKVVSFKDRVTGEERWSLVKATPIPDGDGRPALVINIFDDITEQKRRELSERLLSEGSRLLTSSLDYEVTLDNVAHLAVPGFADWCAVDLVDERGAIRQVALAHADPSKIVVAEQMRNEYPSSPDDPRGVPNVIRTGKAEVYLEIPDELLVGSARDARHLTMLREIGLKSAIVAPMKAVGRTLGAITFVIASTARRFDERDVELANELSRRAATAVENARLYAERTHIAQTLQRSLLPPVLPDIPGIEVAARFRPAGEGYEVGGDFYDVFDTGAGWGFVIGDVCGKGPEAAALTGLARHTVRAAAMQEPQPSRVLTMLNDAIRREHPDSQFCTAAYGSLVPGTAGATLTLASGGHPLPLLLTESGEVHQVGEHGALLGTFPEVELHDERFELERGAALVLFTDGVIEAGEPRGAFGIEALRALLASSAGLSAYEIAERIDAAVVGVSNEPPDDVAVVVLRARD